jgi:CheY-like chemotaxis protein
MDGHSAINLSIARQLQSRANEGKNDVTPDERRSPVPHQLRVLIADDEPDTVLTLTQLLRDEGHETRGVQRGADVLAALRDFDADAVLLDISMPGMSGCPPAVRLIRCARASHARARHAARAYERLAKAAITAWCALASARLRKAAAALPGASRAEVHRARRG